VDGRECTEQRAAKFIKLQVTVPHFAHKLPGFGIQKSTIPPPEPAESKQLSHALHLHDTLAAIYKSLNQFS
jgi:hypothetical protein